MTNEEILIKALEKAIENGYIDEMTLLSDLRGSVFEKWTVEKYTISNDGSYDSFVTYSLRDYIFSHDFVKAFWGESMFRTPFGLIEEFRPESIYIEAWKYHLQQMVLEENPLKYLERFL